MKQTINITEINKYLFARTHDNTIMNELDRAGEHGQLLYGTHNDICASQQNKKFTLKLRGKRISVYDYN